MYNKFLKTANSFIKYFYENLNSDYIIYKNGLPSVQNKIVSKVVKGNKGKDAKIVRENFKIQYITKNGSVFLHKDGEILKDGDLKTDGIHSMFLGRHIIRNGDRNQRLVRTYDPMSEFYHLNDELFKTCDVAVDQNVVMGGCFKSNKETLQRTMIPDIECEVSGLPSMSKIKIFESAIKSAIRKLKIVELAKCFEEDLDLTAFNSETFPGFHLNAFMGHKNKGEAASDAMYLAKKRWKTIERFAKKNKPLQRNKLFPNTYVVGARNKREYHFEDDEVLTSRAVHMPEFHSEINSSIWMEQVTNHIKRESRGPIYIGNSIVTYDRLVKDIFDRGKCIEGDWKRFDSRLYITNIIIGLSILRLYYPLEDKEIDYHFLAIFDTIGIKDYITPGGFLYRIIHGLPSGVCSTNVLGSIINLVNLLFCTGDYDSKRINYIVGGDDFLISLGKEGNYSEILAKMEERAAEIGQVFKILEEKDISSENILERPCFYKYTIDRNEPVVFPTALLERTFLPWNKRYKSDFLILKFLNDLLPSLGAPRTFHLPFYNFYCSIFNKTVQRKERMKVQDVYTLHDGIYTRVLKGFKFQKEDSIKDFKNFSQISTTISFTKIKLNWITNPKRENIVRRKCKFDI